MKLKESLRNSSLFVLVLFILDFVSKFVFRGADLEFFGNVGFFGVENKGAIFGFLQGYNWVFAIISVIIIAVLIYYSYYMPGMRLGFGFILAGAFGNLFDRIFYGAVIDFIHLGFWPAFNLADVFVIVGVVFSIYKLSKQKSI